ncbi:MAG: response regulator [Candidatus Roizmanbacteria bacterium]
MAHILIVEKDIFLAKAYKVKLKKGGYTSDIVMDGTSAIAYLEKQRPDAILTGLVTPNKDGFALLEYIKGIETLHTVPVVVVSNLGQTEDVEKVMNLGAKKYFKKRHVTLDEVKTAFDEILVQK